MKIHLSKIIGLAIAACTTLTACQNDLINSAYKEGDENRISFGATTPDQWPENRLPETKHSIVNQTVLRGENPNDSLCLAMSISDYFEEPITRGKPITSSEFNNFGVFCFTHEDKPFMVNEKQYKNKDNIWSSENIYYWPDAETSLSFFAYSPYNPKLKIAKTNSKYCFDYTVPAKAADQQDIMVANNREVSNAGISSPITLSFKHICTAIRFVTDTDFQAGTIKKITLKNIQASGTFDMETLNWLEGGNQEGSHSEDLNIIIGDNDGGGTSILDKKTTLMMIPQTANNAVIEILINTTKGEKVITGKLPATWEMGKKISYKISITPDYGLSIEGDGKTVDAHYAMSSINITAKGDYNNWTLTSDADWLTFSNKLTDYAKAGYWIEEDKGKKTINGSGPKIPIYIYFTENIGNINRKATLKLRPKNKPNATPVIYTIEQLHPVWGDKFGIEQLEEIPELPWGFNWNHKVEYKINNIMIKFILSIFAKNNWLPNGVKYKKGVATVDYSHYKYYEENSKIDGLKNTNELINFKIEENSNSIIISLIEIYGKPETNVAIITDHIIKHIIQKNKFHYNKSSGENVPKLETEDLVWYLPAEEEYKTMEELLDKDQSYLNLIDTYWTSSTDDTKTDNGLTSFKYTAPGKHFARQDRSTPLKARAVRKKPTTISFDK